MAYYKITEKQLDSGQIRYIVRVRQKASALPYDITKTFDTLSEAQDYAKKTKLNIEQALQSKRSGLNENEVGDLFYSNIKKTLPSKHSSLAEVVNYFLSHKKKTPRPLPVSVEKCLQHIVGSKDGEGYDISTVPLSLLNGEHLRAFCAQRKALGAKPQTVNLDVCNIRRAIREVSKLEGVKELDEMVVGKHFGSLLDDGYIAKSGVRQRRLLKGEYRRILRGFWKKQQSKKVTVNYVAMMVLYVELTVRKTELLNLTWGDIDFKNNFIRITPVKTLKGVASPRDHMRRIPLWGLARKVLKKLKPSNARMNEKLFALKSKSLSSIFPRMMRELGIKDLRLHDLRREGVSRLFELGVPKDIVVVFTGHKCSRMVDEVYKNISAHNVMTNLEIITELHKRRTTLSIAA